MKKIKEHLSFKQFDRMCDEYEKVKYYCKCGHPVIIPIWKEKEECSWCHRYVFKDKNTEFKYRIKERLR